MTALVKVARYHLVDRVPFIYRPVGALAFIFAVNLVVFGIIRPPVNGAHTGAVVSIYIMFGVLGAVCVSQTLPFAFALGISRRTFLLGTFLLMAVMALLYGAGLTVLQAIERGTGGWGLHMTFFRVPFILYGSWYDTLATSFVGLALLFTWGLWFGLIYRRWNVTGMVVFIAAQITACLLAALSITWTHTWTGFTHFFQQLSAMGLTGVMAGLAVLLMIGGMATMRRVTV
ncbi:MAG TPA: hypothetical protein VGG38_04955 [Acidimicrobiales bacterium]|jgi:hypothetical protein